MPWRARADVGLSLLALVLSAATVVSCVSVTTRAAPEPSTGRVAGASLEASPESLDAELTERPARRHEPTTAAPSIAPTPMPTPGPSAGGVAPAAIAVDPTAEIDPSAVTRERPTIAVPTATTLPATSLTPTQEPGGASPPSDPSAAPAATDVAATPSDSPSDAAATEPVPSAAASLIDAEQLQSAAPASAVLDRRTVRRIERILARTTSRKRVAGLQVAVRLSDGQTWTGTAGSATFSPPRPVQDDTVFSIASVSKTFMAALILQLAEEGKLDLDAPYGRYVAIGPRRDRVTVRQLLSHTSGIYDYFSSPRYQRAAAAWLRTPGPASGPFARDHAWTFEEIMDLVKPGPYCKPGRCYRYSNTNYVLLGQVAEAVGGAPLHRLLRRRFFRPLGLTDTYYQPAERPPASAAHGHWPNGNGFTDHTRDDALRPFTAAVTAAGAAGAVASTARDLSVWADALYGGRVLNAASLAALTDIQPEGTYGLGTDYAVFAGHRAYGHRGGLRGFEASMWHFPDEGVSIALLSNEGNWFMSPARSIDIPMQGIVTAVLGKRG